MPFDIPYLRVRRNLKRNLAESEAGLECTVKNSELRSESGTGRDAADLSAGCTFGPLSGPERAQTFRPVVLCFMLLMGMEFSLRFRRITGDFCLLCEIG